jgi:hypothetical protein
LVKEASADLEQRLGVLRGERSIERTKVLITRTTLSGGTGAPSAQINEGSEGKQGERGSLLFVEVRREARELHREPHHRGVEVKSDRAALKLTQEVEVAPSAPLEVFSLKAVPSCGQLRGGQGALQGLNLSPGLALSPRGCG